MCQLENPSQRGQKRSHVNTGEKIPPCAKHNHEWTSKYVEEGSGILERRRRQQVKLLEVVTRSKKKGDKSESKALSLNWKKKLVDPDQTNHTHTKVHFDSLGRCSEVDERVTTKAAEYQSEKCCLCAMVRGEQHYLKRS